MEDFFKPKIVYGQFQDSAEFSFAKSGIFLSSNEYMMIARNYSSKCLLAFLNSKAMEWLLSKITGSLGGNAKIGQKSNFLKLAIPVLTHREQLFFEKKVDQILNGSCMINEIESEINIAIYGIYGLSEIEIQIIEHQ